MRSLDRLIESARRISDNEDYSASAGLSQEEFVQFANDAQERLQNVISATHPMAFVKETTITPVADQTNYSISDHVLLNNRIITVEYSITGRTRDYYKLNQITWREYSTPEQGNPQEYARRDGTIYLKPAPQNAVGSIRVRYERKLDSLDIRRGRVASDSGTGPTTITLEATLPTPSVELDNVVPGDYCCVVDKDGTLQVGELAVTSGSSSTPEIVVADDGSAAAAGDYIVFGKYASTHSQLPDTCERYLVQYMVWRALKRDESDGARQAESELNAMEKDILGAFAEMDMDVNFVPILDDEVL